MSDQPSGIILGLESVRPDDRTLLALPSKGDLSSGQVEAALERRVAEISAHPLASSADAKRLLAQLELAADRLQAEIALAGRGPLHPGAARRAARRMRTLPNAPSAPGSPRAGVSSPIAPQSPAAGLTGGDLTEFDRTALAVLVVSGGWNATSAQRLAMIADEHGLRQEELQQVVVGLTEFLARGGGFRGGAVEVGDAVRAGLARGRAQPEGQASLLAQRTGVEGAVERAFASIEDALRQEVRSSSAWSRVRLAAVFSLFALSWVGVLAYLFFTKEGPQKSAGDLVEVAPMPVPPVAPDSKATVAANAANGDAAVDANGRSVAPIPTLAAPVKFPKPPGFVPSKTPASVVESASAGALWSAELDEAARALASANGHLDGSAAASRAMALATGALSRAAAAWPAAPAYRADAVRAFGALARAAHEDTDALRKLMALVPGGLQDSDTSTGPKWMREWRNAFGAGCLATVSIDRTQPPEVASSAREEMRVRSLPIPKGDVADPFGAAAITWLSAAMPRVTEQLVVGTGSLEDDISRWNEATLAAASSPRLRIDALVAAIDSVLRAPSALDQPGPVVDTLAFFIHALDFTGRGDEAVAVRRALSSWILDKNIPPTRIWVFTSLLDADLGIAWYGPDLVLATNAEMPARSDLADRVDRAFPQVTVTAVGQALLLDAPELERWNKASLQCLGLGSENEAERLRNIAVSLALVRALRGYERGDEKAAKAGFTAADKLIEREGKEWIAPPNGVRAGIAASGVIDGTFAEQWSAKRDAKSRLEAVHGLRSRPAAGDLGPRDARLAAIEALRCNQPEVRSELARVLIDRYANGPELLRAVLDALADGMSSDDARMFIGALTGTTVAGRDWMSEARRALLERIYSIDDSAEHAVDASAAEIATEGAVLAAAYGRTETLVVTPTRPDRAVAAACDAMRDEAATRFLAEPFPAPIAEIERQRAARRSLATSLTQRIAAESASMVEYAAMLVASRQPALQSKLTEVLSSTRRSRVSASSATEQAALDMKAVLEILRLGVAPKATERSAT